MRQQPLGWRARVTVKGTTWHLAMQDKDSACGRYRDLDESETRRLMPEGVTVCKSCRRILEGPEMHAAWSTSVACLRVQQMQHNALDMRVARCILPVAGHFR